MHVLRLLGLLMALALLASACGSEADSSTATTSERAATEVATSEPVATDVPTTEATPEADTPEAEATEPEPTEPSTAEAEAEVTEPDAIEPVSELDARLAALENARWADNVTITISSDMMIFESDGLPSHEYLDQYLGDGRDGKFIAGGVESYQARFEIPIVPTMATAPAETGNGAIGVAISGAVFFDAFEGDGSATVANDDNSTIDGIPFIDACGGHPLPNGLSYHYHGVPFCITDAIDTPGEHSELIGYMFDGYPVYGPQDVGGEAPTDLDSCMGHVGPTPDFVDDTYHYHVSESANYISACLVGEYTPARGRP